MLSKSFMMDKLDNPSTVTYPEKKIGEGRKKRSARIHIGSEFERWNQLRSNLAPISHVELAQQLLDCHYHQEDLVENLDAWKSLGQELCLGNTNLAKLLIQCYYAVKSCSQCLQRVVFANQPNQSQGNGKNGDTAKSAGKRKRSAHQKNDVNFSFIKTSQSIVNNSANVCNADDDSIVGSNKNQGMECINYAGHGNSETSVASSGLVDEHGRSPHSFKLPGKDGKDKHVDIKGSDKLVAGSNDNQESHDLREPSSQATAVEMVSLSEDDPDYEPKSPETAKRVNAEIINSSQRKRSRRKCNNETHFVLDDGKNSLCPLKLKPYLQVVFEDTSERLTDSFVVIESTPGVRIVTPSPADNVADTSGSGHCREIWNGQKVKYQCKACSFSSYNLKNIKLHILHKELGEFVVCHLCGKSFSKQGMMVHQRTMHENKPFPTKPKSVFKCSYENCSYTAKIGFSIKSHILSVHLNNRSFACSWEGCEKRFNTEYALKVHKRTHSDEKPIACCLCDFRCRQKASLNWHMKSKHSDVVKLRPLGSGTTGSQGNWTPRRLDPILGQLDPILGQLDPRSTGQQYLGQLDPYSMLYNYTQK